MFLKIFYAITVGLVLILQLGCSFQSVKEEVKTKRFRPNRAALKEFKVGNSYMDAEKYEKALLVFQKLLTLHPSSEYSLLAIFNIGACQEALGRCEQAVKTYRKATQLGAKTHHRLEARSYLRMSYSYECLDKNDMVVVSLLDVEKRKKHLPLAVAEAELPARLAAAYAREGNRAQASLYFEQAEKGLLKIQAQRKKARIKQELLGKTLFLMGNIKHSDTQKIKGLDFLNNQQSLQKYLLKSVEMRSPTWSPRAAKNLVDSYKKIWIFFKKPEPIEKDQARAHRRTIEFRLKMAEQALENIRQLKVSRFPEEKPSKLERRLFDFVNEEEKKYSSYISSHDLGVPLTKEAKKLQALKREGQTYQPNPKLERRMLKKRRAALPKKIPHKK